MLYEHGGAGVFFRLVWGHRFFIIFGGCTLFRTWPSWGSKGKSQKGLPSVSGSFWFLPHRPALYWRSTEVNGAFPATWGHEAPLPQGYHQAQAHPGTEWVWVKYWRINGLWRHTFQRVVPNKASFPHPLSCTPQIPPHIFCPSSFAPSRKGDLITALSLASLPVLLPGQYWSYPPDQVRIPWFTLILSSIGSQLWSLNCNGSVGESQPEFE